MNFTSEGLTLSLTNFYKASLMRLETANVWPLKIVWVVIDTCHSIWYLSKSCEEKNPSVHREENAGTPERSSNLRSC